MILSDWSEKKREIQGSSPRWCLFNYCLSMMSWAGKAIIYRFPSIFFRRIFFSLSFISFVDDSTRLARSLMMFECVWMDICEMNIWVEPALLSNKNGWMIAVKFGSRNEALCYKLNTKLVNNAREIFHEKFN